MRILFVKTSSLGDVIHQCPAVTDARTSFPDAVIDWVVEAPFAEIAQMHPAVRRVFPVSIRRWRKEIFRASTRREFLDFRRGVRAETYDFVVDTQGLLKSALISLQAKGVRHGFDSGSARESIASVFYQVHHHVERGRHAIDRNRSLTAKALGSALKTGCDYGIGPKVANPIRADGKYCVLLSMTSRADKLWPEQNWSQLLLALRKRGLEGVLPWGSEAERVRCRRIVEAAGHGVVLPSMSLAELAGAMAGSFAVVGVDTGLSHLAAALKVPCVGIYCNTDSELTGLRGDGRLANVGGRAASPSVEEVLSAFGDLF